MSKSYFYAGETEGRDGVITHFSGIMEFEEDDKNPVDALNHIVEEKEREFGVNVVLCAFNRVD